MGLGSLFLKIAAFFGNIFTEAYKKAQDRRLEPLARLAYPHIKKLALSSENKIDDAILAAGESLLYNAEEILATKDDFIKDYGRLMLVGQAVKNDIKKAIAEKGKAKVGDVVYKTPEQVDAISKTTLTAAVLKTVEAIKDVGGRAPDNPKEDVATEKDPDELKV